MSQPIMPVELPNGALACDCCGAPLEQQASGFHCHACQQDHYFTEGRRTSSKLARLYPSAMKKDSTLYRESVAWNVRSIKFDIEARYRLGILDATTRNARLADVEHQWEQWLIDHPEPTQNASRWTRLLVRLRGLA